MTSEDHERLLITLSEIKGKFILSGYNNDLYDGFAIRHGWTRVDREIDCKASFSQSKADAGRVAVDELHERSGMSQANF